MTDAKGGMLGVISAPAPEKAAAKVFREKLAGKIKATKENPFEIRIRDLGAGSNYHFQAWTEVVENRKAEEAGNCEGAGGKKAVKKLVIKRIR